MLHDAILFAVSTKIYRCIVVQSLMLVDTHFDSRKAWNLYQHGLLDWETVGRAIGDLAGAEGIDIKLGLVPPPMDLHFGRSQPRRACSAINVFLKAGIGSIFRKTDLTLLRIVGSGRSRAVLTSLEDCGGTVQPLR